MIRRFDGFRRLLRRAAEGFNHPLRGAEADQDLIPVNRILAGLGGPPAAVRLAVTLKEADTLPMLLLFLLVQPVPAKFVLSGDTEQYAARLKQLLHLLGHAVAPLLRYGGVLSFDETVRELSPALVTVHPLLGFDSDGEVTGMETDGSASELALIGAPGEPLTLTIMGEGLHEVTVTITQEREGWLSYITG